MSKHTPLGEFFWEKIYPLANPMTPFEKAKKEQARLKRFYGEKPTTF